jgi:glycosyltransferase involved in cell wall biosynthesis
MMPALQPLVSVIVATYNGETFLQAQLESLLHQTYTNLEIIVTDDCSTDNTIKILQDFQQKDPRINIYRNDSNLGYIKNFEKGISFANGDYIALCDQDDIWMPGKTESLLNNIGNNSLVFCDSELIDADGNYLNRKVSDLKNTGDYKDCLPFVINNCIYGHAALMPAPFVKDILPFPGIIVHDWWLAYRAAAANGIKYIDVCMVQYRQHSQNAIGASRINKQQRGKEKQFFKNQAARERMHYFSRYAAETERSVLRQLDDSYQSFSLINNYRRMILFFAYHRRLLALKKKSRFRQWLFCLKMFYKIV